MNFNKYSDEEYLNITNDILNHEEFAKLKNIVHHGLNRYDHSNRVAIISYKIAKFLKLDYRKVARGALLHDFFFEENENKLKKERAKVLVKHPSYALDNASKYFSLSDEEKNIIETHMFPVAPKVPKYVSSWLVDIVDDGVSIYEKTYSVRKELSACVIFLITFMSNYIR